MSKTTTAAECRDDANRGAAAFAIVMFFAANLAILFYAIHVTAPSDGAHAPETGGAGAPVAPFPSAVATKSETITTRIALPTVEHTDAMWVQHCVACHGAEGRGDGPAAEQLYPKPRDFKGSPLRFASTGGGKFQVIGAIERSIATGVPRSAMPGFHNVLTDSEISGLARKIHDLRGAQEAAPDSDVALDLGPKPPLTPELVGRGRELYVALGCVACHGESGHGDGPTAKNLRDSIGKPVLPADLASGLFKSGQDGHSLARTILKGVPGTPMTPFEVALLRKDENGNVDATDVWALVYFIEDFTPRRGERGESSGSRIVARRVREASMLADPTSIHWLGVPAQQLALRPLWQRVETTHEITVRAARDEESIAICFEWADASLDLIKGQAEWPDGVAVMLAPDGKVPALPMGVSIPGFLASGKVNVWHWRADRQVEAILHRACGGAEFEPVADSATVIFAEGSTSIPAILEVPGGMNYDGFADSPDFLSAVVAGNREHEAPVSARAALESLAVGFGSLTPTPESEQDLSAAAVWSSGVWRVVIRRPLTSRGIDDIPIESGTDVPVAFAVWNGARGDRAGVKQITSWHWLTLGENGDKP
jgi:DMSO reductase family type II enzyme heme b subunit